MAREDENPTEKKAEVQEEAKTEGKSVRKRRGEEEHLRRCCPHPLDL